MVGRSFEGAFVMAGIAIDVVGESSTSSWPGWNSAFPYSAVHRQTNQ